MDANLELGSGGNDSKDADPELAAFDKKVARMGLFKDEACLLVVELLGDFFSVALVELRLELRWEANTKGGRCWLRAAVAICCINGDRNAFADIMSDRTCNDVRYLW